jgi:hypothetical protein
MKMTDYAVASYSLVGIDRRFRGAYCLHHNGDDGATSQTTVTIFFTLVYSESKYLNKNVRQFGQTIGSLHLLNSIFLQQTLVPPHSKILNYNKDCNVLPTFASINGIHFLALRDCLNVYNSGPTQSATHWHAGISSITFQLKTKTLWYGSHNTEHCLLRLIFASHISTPAESRPQHCLPWRFLHLFGQIRDTKSVSFPVHTV